MAWTMTPQKTWMSVASLSTGALVGWAISSLDIFKNSFKNYSFNLSTDASIISPPYQVTDAVQNVARILHCVAHSNLTISETVVMRLIQELSGRLLLLTEELSKAVSISSYVSIQQYIFSIIYHYLQHLPQVYISAVKH